MSEKIIKIELHTIAIYNGKEYELEELMNNMFELNGKLHEQLQQKENIIKELNGTIKELQEDIDVLTSDDDNDSVWLEKENM